MDDKYLTDVAYHFLIEQLAGLFLLIAIYLCRHRLHRFWRIVLVLVLDLIGAAITVKLIG